MSGSKKRSRDLNQQVKDEDRKRQKVHQRGGRDHEAGRHEGWCADHVPVGRHLLLLLCLLVRVLLILFFLLLLGSPGAGLLFLPAIRPARLGRLGLGRRQRVPAPGAPGSPLRARDLAPHPVQLGARAGLLPRTPGVTPRRPARVAVL